MYKIILLIFLMLFTNNVSSNENLLTIQQQLERLQREVSDISEIVFSNSDLNNLKEEKNENDLVKNLSAIDMRIYDIERDIKNLTANLEDILFKIEDIITQVNNFEIVINSLENNIVDVKNENLASNDIIEIDPETKAEKNTLGSLKISTDDNISNDIEKDTEEKVVNEEKLSPEDQFQSAFDNIRNKKWEDAKKLLLNFIEENPKNQLAGSAHYWLGELYILEKKYRDAALILAEGYQKFPQSIKSPDILFKLSISLNEVGKIDESCKTLEKLMIDFPKNKYSNNVNKNLKDYGCQVSSQ